jgi:hypothetical protein
VFSPAKLWWMLFDEKVVGGKTSTMEKSIPIKERYKYANYKYRRLSLRIKYL